MGGLVRLGLGVKQQRKVLDGRAVTSYTRWVDAVQVMGDETQEVYLTFSPRFEHIWLQCRKRLLDYLAQKPAAIGLRSQYAIRLYAWAKDHFSAGAKRITLEELRKVLGLESVKDADGNVIREARLAAWANFRQRNRAAQATGGCADRLPPATP